MGIFRRDRLASLGLVLALAAAPSAAQDANGTITGTVADQQGQVLPGATITLVNEANKLFRTGVADARGDFRFTSLLPGTYTVKVELQGFKAFEKRGNVLNAASTLSLGQVKLGLGALTEVIVVEDSGAKVNVEETQHSGLLTSTQIEQLQSKGRDVVNLLRAIPGVRYGDDSDALGESFGTVVPNINGQRANWARTSIDGLNASESGGGNRMGSAISLDGIAEVKVLLNQYRAEFGGSGGANIQVVTKTGTSDYRGTVYWLGRRTNWNANRWENNKSDFERPEYNYNTYGFNIGGPMPGQKNDKKVFFFYNLEVPLTERSGALRRWRVPTEAERRGDFSQTLVSGSTTTPVKVLDPRRPGENVPLPGNIVPPELIDPNMQALMNLYPLPNRTDLSETKNQYNLINQGHFDDPRQNHFLRLDWRPNEKDNVFFSGRWGSSDKAGVDAPGSPATGKWGFFDPTYYFGDASLNLGYTRIFGSSVINEFSVGVRNQWEEFGTRTDADLARLTRAGVGYNRGQFFPGANSELNLIPRVDVNNLNPSGVTAPDIDYADRIGQRANDYLFAARDNLTWTKRAHTFKAGFNFERWAQNEAPGGNYMGRFAFDNAAQSTNPVSSTVPYANFLMGTFRTYAEVDSKQDTANRQSRFEWYVQDTWKASRRLTVDLGVRFLWYQQYHQGGDILHAAFAPERHVLGASPRMYVPGPNNTAVDPENLSDARRPSGSFAGRFVPNSGTVGNGMVLSNDDTYPQGFRDNNGIHPEPSVALAWDVFGNGKTALHTGVSLRHQGYMGGGYQGNLRGVPAQKQIQLPNSTTELFLASGGFEGPTGVGGLQRDAKTPSVYSMNFGITQEVGWGTVIDVSYVGAVNRHMDMVRNINRIPLGARFASTRTIDHPVRTIDTINPVTGAKLGDNWLRPYEGLSSIGIHEHWATQNYNALQAQLTRRYIKGLQFSIAYTWSKAMGYANNDPGNNNANWTPERPLSQYYSPLDHNQTHNFVTNFTYDFPRLGGPAPVKFLLDNWQVSGEYVWASGDWAGVSLDLNPNRDLVGGENCVELGCDGGANLIMLRNPRKKGGSPFDPENRWFDIDAFAAPTADNLGNTPRTVIQRPPINSLNVSLFKNFSLGGPRRVQLRLEGYNVLNHTQIRDVGRTIQFNAAGEMTNRDVVGLATGSARPPRILQASMRLNF